MAPLGNKDLTHYHMLTGVGTGLIEISHPPEADDEGKTRGHVRSKTPASRAVMMLFKCIKPCFASLYRGLQMCEIYIKPRPFMRSLLIFKGAHEIASLSWFFCVMTKEQEIKSKEISTKKQDT
jgi:hypothetical protein